MMRHVTAAAAVMAAVLAFGALSWGQDSYYLYVDWPPEIGEATRVTGAGGYIDTSGNIEGLPGAEYLFFVAGPDYEGARGAHVGYCYRVETDGDANRHPDNPLDTGPIAARTFTFVSSHLMTEYPDGQYYAGHTNDFQVDETGIYYGPSWGGIYHWDFDWTPHGWVIDDFTGPGWNGYQTLARNPGNGDWWMTSSSRGVYKWDGATWVAQFVHPDLTGGHSDGMEIIGNSLFISDMTSDVIIQYRLDAGGNVIDPPDTPYKTFTYSASPVVEGMGYGPNQHIWIAGYGSRTVYELGGGEIQLEISQIPDQVILEGQEFTTFDLDDYATGKPPLSWGVAGSVDLTINVDPDKVVTIAYPPGWIGSETVTFSVTDGDGTAKDIEVTLEVRPRTLLINYQGRLSTSAGDPVNADKAMTFRIYNSAGTELWVEVQSVAVAGGIFNVLLGTETVIPENLFDDPVRFLGVSVGGEEMSPRQRITSVAYAARALSADKLNGLEADDFVRRSGDVMTGPLDVRSSFRAGTHSLVYDDATGYVGIGTETPTEALEVLGNAMADMFIGDGSSLTGVNADLLDGMDSAYFLPTTGKAADADRLDGLHSSSFARSTHDHWAEAWTGKGTGLTLTTTTAGDAGLQGEGPTYGLIGMATAGTTRSAGVFGTTLGSSGVGAQPSGVLGETDSGYGVSGLANNGTAVYAYSEKGRGVWAVSYASAYPAVLGMNANGNGVVGRHGTNTSFPDVDAGVYGSSSTAHAVYGKTDATSGENYGGYFEGNSHNGGGVLGVSENGYGVRGVHTHPSYTAPAVMGENTGSGAGVYGTATGTNAGVLGRSSGTGPAVEADGYVLADEVRYSSPRTHYLSISGEGFHPGSNVNYFNTYGMGGAYVDAAGGHALVAPVHLPDGATVTSFRVYFDDTSAGDMIVYLHRQYLSSGGYVTLAEVQSSGTGGYYSLADSTIGSATINNNGYGYSIYAYSTSWSSNLQIRGVVITYTLDKAQ